MCILVFDWQPDTEQPLLLLANRDEFHARPSAPLMQWDDQPLVHAGRDLEAGVAGWEQHRAGALPL